MKKLAFCLLPVALAPGLAAQAAEKPRQLVIISFDGAHNNALWEKSLHIARKNRAHFTYFLSCAFLMSPAERAAYKPPHQTRSTSNVGFERDPSKIKIQLAHIWRAHLDGHDIASHACGHFDGGHWSQADWAQEFASFKQTLMNAYEANGLETDKPEGWAHFVDTQIRGFRAPYLSVSPGLAPALKAAGYTYDASLVSRGPALPETQKGVVRFSLPLIPEGPKDRRIIAMDYNLFVRHSKAVETPERSVEFEQRAYDAFRGEFDRQYSGKRIPLQIGFHFVEMNGGAYWRALERLTSEVCGKPDVDCISYAEAVARMKESDAVAGLEKPGL